MDNAQGDLLAQLREEVWEIEQKTDIRFAPARAAAASPPPPAPMARPDDRTTNDHGETFGRWLLAQKDRGDWIDELATAARRDPGFPKLAGPDGVRDYLTQRGIMEADVFEQLDDAERCWRTA